MIRPGRHSPSQQGGSPTPSPSVNTTSSPVTEKPKIKPWDPSKFNTRMAGFHQININITATGTTGTSETKVKIAISMSGKYGGLSPVDYPLWQLYAGMTGVYCSLAFFWLLMMACNWRDLIRLQYWIGAVIGLGMIEKAVFFSAYNSVKETGEDAQIVILAELVSCVKRTLARVLVIIASTGFGIVKPRLGPILNKILLLGGVYFILCLVAGLYDATKPGYEDPDNKKLILQLPLLVLDAGICWWVSFFNWLLLWLSHTLHTMLAIFLDKRLTGHTFSCWNHEEFASAQK
eukprot:m.185312 g.185312  ORF g.185312 m.185312 type:complete len:290 (+) comp39335_c0_seq23:280-1149(+)